MKVIFLGTNGWYDTETGNTVCVLVETKNEYVIFDAGNGFYKIDKYITKRKPIYLLLSHYHLDHVIGLHALAKFAFKQGIDIYGPPGLKTLFKEVINTPYTIPIYRLKMRIGLNEVLRPGLLPAGIAYKPLKHSVPCYGYRLYSEGKAIAYCTDTGICDNLFYLAKEADLLIAECSFKKGQKNNAWPHLNPESAAKVAKESKAKKLALMHFDARLYLNFKDRLEAGKESRKTFNHTLVGRDNLKVTV
jgi:ribonuclease BN (tRNA processing enzyme)